MIIVNALLVWNNKILYNQFERISIFFPSDIHRFGAVGLMMDSRTSQIETARCQVRCTITTIATASSFTQRKKACQQLLIAEHDSKK